MISLGKWHFLMSVFKTDTDPMRIVFYLVITGVAGIEIPNLQSSTGWGFLKFIHYSPKIVSNISSTEFQWVTLPGGKMKQNQLQEKLNDKMKRDEELEQMK